MPTFGRGEARQDALRWLFGSTQTPRVVVIATHPDDETIGIGGQLARLSDVHIVHVTSGAPMDLRFARDVGFETREAYAAARRGEIAAVMGIAGIGLERLVRVRDDGQEFLDQQVVERMPALAGALQAVLEELEPAVVVTHPFEGGHPDHDAVAFASAAAVHRIASAGRRAPALVEMALYHLRDGKLRTNTFVERRDVPSIEIHLDEADRQRKRRMLDAYLSQRAVLEPFGVERESFRIAPAYDFTRPPHAGELHYERERWTTWAAWRAHAETAIAALR